jgi:hypothetical protein
MLGMSTSNDIAEQLVAIDREIEAQRQTCVNAAAAMAKAPTDKAARTAHRKASGHLAELVADREALKAAFDLAAVADREQRRAERIERAKQLCETASQAQGARSTKAFMLEIALAHFVNALADWAGAQQDFENAIANCASTLLTDNARAAGFAVDRRREVVEVEVNRAAWHRYSLANELAKRMFRASALLGHAGAEHLAVKFMGNPNELESLHQADVENGAAAVFGLRDFVNRWSKPLVTEEQDGVEAAAK